MNLGGVCRGFQEQYTLLAGPEVLRMLHLYEEEFWALEPVS